MLNERERRSLREIELRLVQQDPVLARGLEVGPDARGRRRLSYDIAAGVSAFAAVLCVALPSSATLGAGAVAAVLAAVIVLLRRRHFPRTPIR